MELVPAMSDRRLRKEVDEECPDSALEIFLYIYVGLTCSGQLDMTWEGRMSLKSPGAQS